MAKSTELDVKLVGDSKLFRIALQRVPEIAQSQGDVLITGETGTGKGEFAKAIHQMSPRAGKPFIRINCAAIPAGLLESGLFGHERGAFTGAHSAALGAFRAAEGGI